MMIDETFNGNDTMAMIHLRNQKQKVYVVCCRLGSEACSSFATCYKEQGVKQLSHDIDCTEGYLECLTHVHKSGGKKES